MKTKLASFLLASNSYYWLKTLSKFVSVQLAVQSLSIASGLLLVRTLSKEEYAYFTIVGSMQGTMNLLADSGISTGLISIGGKVWQNSYRFGQLINTAMKLRRYLATISAVVVAPIIFWMLVSNGSSVGYTIVMVVATLVGLNFQLTVGVLEVVPRLYSQISRVQIMDLVFAVSRLFILGISYLILLNALTAVLAGSLALGIESLLLGYWARDSLDINAPVHHEDRSEIIKIVRNLLPSTIYYCVQGQLTVFLISIFGNTQKIAEVGALGRLGIFFSIIYSVMNGIILPKFSRCQSFNILCRQYCKIISFLILIELLLIILAGIFPSQFIWILGKHYAHLKSEVLLLAISSSFSSIVGMMWSLNASKAWVNDSWFYVPGTIAIQILLLFILDLSTVRGIIMFGMFSNIPFFIINIWLTYKGLISYRKQKFQIYSNDQNE